MRTPEEIAKKIVRSVEVSDNYQDEAQMASWAEYLTEWRDECVAEAKDETITAMTERNALQEMRAHDALIIKSLKDENALALRYRRALEIIESYIGHDEGARVCQQTARNALKGGEL
jgi:hypothetical protein